MGLSSSKSSTSSSSTNTSSPLAEFAPYINQGLQTAQGVMTSNQGNLNNLSSMATGIANSYAAPQAALGSIYTGSNPAQSTYTSLQNAKATDPSLSTLGTMAQGNSAYNSIGTGNPAYSSLSDIANGVNNNPAFGALGNMTNATTDPLTQQFYQDTLGGKYLNNNPYIDQITGQATDAATKAQNARFASSGMGEGMSTPYSAALGTAVANANNQTRYQAYTDELARMGTIGGQADTQYNAGQDRALSAANDLGSLYNTATGLRTNAASALGSLYNQTGQLRLGAQQAQDSSKLGAATALGNQNTNDNNTSLNAANGSINAILQALGLSGSLSNDQLQALYGAAQIPYTGVNNYANLVNGLTGKYGTTSGTSNSTTISTPSLMQTAMQGLSLGSSLMGGMGISPLAGLAGMANSTQDLTGALSSGLSPLNLTPNYNITGLG